jgi:acetoacetyl-CoA reductase/3-oxoacyl-[acyl-carrier protein] reductase
MSSAHVAALTSLEGRVALVAGGSGGIGAAVVTLFAQAGARVVSVDRPGSTPSANALRSLECDVTDAHAVAELFARLAADQLAPELLVHTVGITRDAMLWKLDLEAWSSVMRTNLDSAFLMLRAAIGPMRARGAGAIVLLSSINGERGKLGQANYAASKAGLIGLAKTAAREFGRFGVRVNVVAPGLVDTAMTRALAPEVRAASIAESALGRAAQPDDVASAVLFLCSDMSRHITGQVLRVDGGQLIA